MTLSTATVFHSLESSETIPTNVRYDSDRINTLLGAARAKFGEIGQTVYLHFLSTFRTQNYYQDETKGQTRKAKTNEHIPKAKMRNLLWLRCGTKTFKSNGCYENAYMSPK